MLYPFIETVNDDKAKISFCRNSFNNAFSNTFELFSLFRKRRVIITNKFYNRFAVVIDTLE